MTDPLDGIFDSLEPEDFMTAATPIAKKNTDAFDFQTFMNSCVQASEFAFYAANGMPNPMAVLATPGGQLTYCPTDGETLGHYVQRLEREARLNGAFAMFLMKLTTVATRLTDPGEDIDVTSREAMASAADRSPGLYFYAESPDHEVTHGFWRIQGERSKATLHSFTAIEGTHQPNEALSGILRRR